MEEDEVQGAPFRRVVADIGDFAHLGAPAEELLEDPLLQLPVPVHRRADPQPVAPAAVLVRHLGLRRCGS